MEPEQDMEDDMPAVGTSARPPKRFKKGSNKRCKSGGFESLNLASEIYGGIRRTGYKVPTPIQRKAMPLALAGADVVAMARTGSGKTAAFLIPMLQKLRQHVPQAGVRALVLSPTRDLAMQTLKFTKELGQLTDLRTSLLVGGDSMENQFDELTRNPDIIIATPGRLMHHLTEVEDMSLRTVEYVVFDEADSLFSMGFAEQLHKILTKLSDNRQTLLFSATMPKALAEFAKAGLRDPQLIRLDLESKISADLTTVFFTLRQEEKLAAVLYLVRERISSKEQTLIFVSTKHHVEFLHTLFREEGIESSVSYGDMDQDARKISISSFRSRKTKILIVTDIAARGLDIPLLDNVVNWDFPSNPKLFVHRVGRVARAGRTGTAYSFVTAEDMPHLLDLHLFLSKPLKPAPSEEEVLNNIEAANLKIEQALANGETVYGRFPQPVLALISERVKEIIDGSSELSLLQKTCSNAFLLYTKTKPLPSKESIRRVKDLPREGLHPMFRQNIGADELSALAFSERLKSYRPKQTILEAEREAINSKNSQGSSVGLDVMKKKRAVHEEIIKSVHEKQSTVTERKDEVMEDISMQEKKGVSGKKRKITTFRDDEYYISSVPQNQHMEAGLAVRGNEGFVPNNLDAAVLDLVGDDSSGLQSQKQKLHWDKRKKKYVKLNNGERVTASGKVVTEGGAKVRAMKTDIYKKWKEKTQRTITLDGRSGDDDDPGPVGDRGGNNGHSRFGKRQRWSKPNANVPSEIKDADRMVKERVRKAIRVSWMKNKSGKGPEGGRPNRELGDSKNPKFEKGDNKFKKSSKFQKGGSGGGKFQKKGGSGGGGGKFLKKGGGGSGGGGGGKFQKKGGSGGGKFQKKGGSSGGGGKFQKGKDKMRR